MSRLLDELRKCKARDDRGMMANLRCILVDSKKHRAWPVLNRLGVAINDDVSAYVAGLFATHPEETPNGNFGATCKSIERNRGEKQSDDNKLTPTERRFQHVLAAEGWEELRDRVLRMVRMAKSEDIPVNYEQLEIDLKILSNPTNTWRERTRTRWAAAFWTPGAVLATEEDV
jgi:CRISPR system Cascade subunit CasB